MARVALVTGGSRGIGAAIAMKLKTEGYNVAASYAGNDEAAAKFTETIAAFSCDVTVSKNNETVSGSSIMGLLMLAASKGTSIHISMAGIDAERAMQKVVELVDNKFYEE